MKPYNHVSTIDPRLKQLCTYLNSQCIKYRIHGYDYDLPFGAIEILGYFYVPFGKYLKAYKPYQHKEESRILSYFPMLCEMEG